MLRPMKCAFIAAAVSLCLTCTAQADEAGFDRLESRLRQAEQSGRWRDVISLNREILSRFRKDDFLSVAYRQSDIGDAYLHLLDFESASRIYRRLVDAKQDELGLASLGLARIAAERGNYSEALTRLKGYEESFGSGCGNCMESRRQFSHLHRTIWQCANLPADQAQTRLRGIIAGGFKPLPGSLTQPEWYKNPAIREAKLALAGIYRRAGRVAEARALYQQLRPNGDEPDEPIWMAKAYLAVLPQSLAPSSPTPAPPANRPRPRAL